MRNGSPSQKDHQTLVEKYQDAFGKWHRLTPATRAVLRHAIGPDPTATEVNPPVAVIYPGETLNRMGPSELTLEDGTTLRIDRHFPPDLPSGYHYMRNLAHEQVTQLIVTPGKCYLPPHLKAWGWAVQLYALRSHQSWGMGDLADLRQFGGWSQRNLNAGFLLVNPLNATVPLRTQDPSPYYPSSRRFHNPLYVRIEEVPGARESGLRLEKLVAAGQALNQERYVDRIAIFRLKMQALQQLWARFPGHPRFEHFCVEQGDALAQFATFCALAEMHGSGWTQWPTAFQKPGSAAVARFAVTHRRRIRFHQWLQWLFDEQFARAARAIPLMQDLPIGVDPGGADAWSMQTILAQRIRMGAPPDEYNTQGQNWGLLPFHPFQLRAAGYEPFRQIIRSALRHHSHLRLDHVMGLFRLFWIPEGATAKVGAYVRYRAEELLAILAIESQRAQAIVVGEDLGTVESSIRAVLRRQNILSYRLLWFESEPLQAYPKQAMAAVTTHDLFTIAGLWTGKDLKKQEQLGLHPNVTGAQNILKKLTHQIQAKPSTPLPEVIVRTHRLLAKAPSMLLTATLEDALALEDRPNMPGTTGEKNPNWSIALPQSVEQIRSNRLVREVAGALSRRGSHSLKP